MSKLSVALDRRRDDANDAAYAGACDFIFPVCSDDAVTRGRELLASGEIGGGASGQYWYWYVMKALGLMASIFMLFYYLSECIFQLLSKGKVEQKLTQIELTMAAQTAILSDLNHWKEYFDKKDGPIMVKLSDIGRKIIDMETRCKEQSTHHLSCENCVKNDRWL